MKLINGLIVRTIILNQTRIVATLITAILVIFITPVVIAQNSGHPLITAFSGSYLEKQEVMEFDEQQLVLGKVQPDGTVKTERLAGKVTRLDYRDPDDRSSLERFRNYEQGLKEAGFEILYSCNKEECGPETQIETIGYFPPERYLTAVLKKPAGNVWVGVLVAAGPWTKIKIVELKPMDTGMVKVTADILHKNILTEGHMAVYGIYFDTGKSEVKTESAETLTEIAALLRLNPLLQIYVVGHTDNVGTLTDNLDLSNRRAAAVVSELTTHYKVPASRLQAGGVGPLSPVATNDTDQGKRLNRRVEIVKK